MINYITFLREMFTIKNGCSSKISVHQGRRFVLKTNMNEWIKSLINKKERSIVPLATYPAIEITGQKITDVVKSGQAQYECIKAMSERFPSEAAVMVMDLSVEAEAFGSPVEFSDTDIPTVKSNIVSDRESVDALKVPAIGTKRTGEYVEAARLASLHITDRPVFGGTIGPYTLAGRLFDITNIMMAVMLEPEIIHSLLSKCTSFLIDYIQAFKDEGANGVIMAEPAAGLLSPVQCTEFSSCYIKQVVEAVQDDTFIIILHNCGNTEKLVPSMLSTGCAGFHFGNAVDMTKIMPQVPRDRLAFGNIDPAGIIKTGPAETIREKTLELLQKTGEFENFVLSSGCDVPPGTPLENIQALYDALTEYNRKVRMAI